MTPTKAQALALPDALKEEIAEVPHHPFAEIGAGQLATLRAFIVSAGGAPFTPDEVTAIREQAALESEPLQAGDKEWLESMAESREELVLHQCTDVGRGIQRDFAARCRRILAALAAGVPVPVERTFAARAEAWIDAGRSDRGFSEQMNVRAFASHLDSTEGK